MSLPVYAARLVAGVRLPRSAFWTKIRRERVCPQHGERPGRLCYDCGTPLQEREIETPTSLLESLVDMSEHGHIDQAWERLAHPYPGQMLAVVGIPDGEYVLGHLLGTASTRQERHHHMSLSKIEDKMNVVRAMLAERGVLGPGRHVEVHLVLS